MRAYVIFAVLMAFFAPIAFAITYFAALFGHPWFVWFWRDFLAVIQ